MATKNVKVVMKQRTDTSANWTAQNPVLAKGEIGYDETNDLFKIGDGTTVWNSLSYRPGKPGTGQNSEVFNETSNIASGVSSHAEGTSTEASGTAAHAEGGGTIASGTYSHTEGLTTIAAGEYQHVQGRYNIEDSNNKYAHIVGNGQYENESNAHTLDWSGNAWYAGNIKIGGTSYDDANAKELVSEDSINNFKYYEDSNINPSPAEYFGTIEVDESIIASITSSGKTQSELVIPYKFNGGTVRTIGDGYSLTDSESNITKIILPNTVINILGNSFKELTKLESIYIPNSVELIANNAIPKTTTICCGLGSIADIYAKTNGNDVLYIYEEANPVKANLTSIGGVNQVFDSTDKFDFTGKNINATELDSTLTGDITKGATGNYASSFGGKSAAMGKRSHAEGTTTIAKGNYSHAEGDNSVTLGGDSHAEGYSTVAKGDQSHTEGILTVAIGQGSHAEGYGSKTNSAYSHVEGEYTITGAEAAHAEGFYTEANGMYSHAEGNKSKVINVLPTSSGGSGSSGGSSGSGSTGSGSTVPESFNMDDHLGESAHVEGAENEALGYSSHAEGGMNKAYGHLSHVEGCGNITGTKTSISNGKYSHAEGYCTSSEGNSSHSEGAATIASGDYSHAEGAQTTATEPASHAEGAGSHATGAGSHAEGEETTASGACSHSEGYKTNASKMSSHAEGYCTSSEGNSSHSEGEGTIAKGDSSHAEGMYSYATGTSSHAEGFYTITSCSNQHVQGRYNIEDNSDKYAHIVGNGSSSKRSNAHTLDWNGNAWYQGKITIGGTYNSSSNTVSGAQEVATKDYVDSKVASSGSGSGSGGSTSSIVTCTGDELSAIASPTIGSLRLVTTAGTTNTAITVGLYLYANITGTATWHKIALETTAIVSGDTITSGDSNN